MGTKATGRESAKHAADSVVLDAESKKDQRGRRILSEQRWAEVLAAYANSALTQAQFARQEGVNYHTLVAHLGRARRAASAAFPAQTAARRLTSASTNLAAETSTSHSPAFIEAVFPPNLLAAAAAHPSRPPLEVILPNGLLIRGVEPAALATLVRALMN